ncbi:hypothetical protein MPSEU_000739400 [Mayamaea pseudoterrestris]|nr:hypothetical protein MPSEU_000739400 [Mayamaea pseudoterrestris]
MLRRAWNKHKPHDDDDLTLSPTKQDVSHASNGEPTNMATMTSDSLLQHDDEHADECTRKGTIWQCWRLLLQRALRPSNYKLQKEYKSMCRCFVLVVCLAIIALFHSSILRQRLLQLGEDSLLRPLLSIHIQPSSIMETKDSLETGKFCLPKHGMWKCYDCGKDDNEKNDKHTQSKMAITATTSSSSSSTQTWHRKPKRERCKKLQPRGKCKPFLIPRRDVPVRVRPSPYDGTSRSTQSTRTLGLRPRFFYEQQPTCATLDDCWDLSRCMQLLTENDSDMPVLTVYLNETDKQHYLLDYLTRQAVANSSLSSFRLERVNDHSKACLVLVTPQTYETANDLLSSEHWRHTYRRKHRHHQHGTNHLLWHTSYFFLNDTKTIDLPFSLSWHAAHAALASASLDRASHRPNYDMVLPLPRMWGRAEAPQLVLDNVRQSQQRRKWLLGFRGKIQATPHVYYHHRWLAAEYWLNDEHEDNDIIVDVKCQREQLPSGRKVVEKDYDNQFSYANFLWDTYFGFAPGGSGVGSFRFGEILSTGGIPVILPDYVPPFAPEVDWSECVIVVSEARIIDLPNILRRIPLHEVTRRQEACWKLLQVTLGDTTNGMFLGKKKEAGLWHDDERVTFRLAMELWVARIVNAMTMKQRVERLVG